MRWGPVLGGAAGLALSAWLLSSFGLLRIIGLIGHAGWLGILAVTAFHLTEVLCSALAWLNIAANTQPRAGARFFLRLRLIREAVNSLLPLAQIGGEVVVSRLLAQRGVNLAAAIAGTVADLTLEMATQIAFTFAGLMLLLRNAGPTPMAAYLLGGLLIAAVLIAALLAAMRSGLTATLERLLLRIGRHMGWAGIDPAAAPDRSRGLRAVRTGHAHRRGVGRRHLVAIRISRSCRRRVGAYRQYDERRGTSL